MTETEQEERMTHEEFIAAWLEKHPDPTQTCRQAVLAMTHEFPELTAVRGHVVMLDAPDGDTSPWPHWWCVDEDGAIVDPTASQFPSELEYKPVDESKGEPTGRCPNCGGLCYGHRYLCSEECEKQYAAYVSIF